MSYTFENLSPLDFEKLGVDLLQKHLEQPLIETFKPGKDWGIDGRFINGLGQTTIIQFKHYKNFQDLKSNLKKYQKNRKTVKPKIPYNKYSMFLRWASDRIDKEGIISL
ncbi:MAG: restriction endonuclease [Bdellovibrionales bacterium]|nr:restriction endonuclease [Bdellovibrionales bacterium]